MENSALAPALFDACRRARAEAPFLRLLLDREPDIASAAAEGRLPAVEDARIDDPAMPVGQRLRLERRRLALIVALGDLAGLFDLTAVTGALSDFADYALDAAIAAAIGERTPDAPCRGFTAIALGKQGSHELNYSSDIDPILLFDPATLPCRPREEPADAAVRIARRVVELLQTRDGDGYVLRVDLRLRPSPEATPIALPVDAAISYYESLALPWERAAFIRARAAAGDRALGNRFLETIRPFIWRRALDFGAIGEIRDISRRIRDHHAQGQAFGPGFDLKRGRGGIREIEFFAQIHQLIHGGRDPALREPATRDALARLAAAGWIGADESGALSHAYTMLRTIEHRVQMVEDRQTHHLPTGTALDGVARLHGVADGAALLDLLRPSVATVAATYDSLDAGEGTNLSADRDLLIGQLDAAGFAHDDGVAELIDRWRGGTYPALRSPAARAALEAVLPSLVEALGAAPDPHAAIVRLDVMLGRLSSAVNFFRLIEARPALARLLGAILSHTPTLADALGRRPELFDGLVDASALDPVGSVEALIDEMRLGAGDGDYQQQLDHVRRVVGEKRFALGTQIVAGVSDPLDVSAGYARIAEAAIGVLATAATAAFVAVHGTVPDSELVILALGRMGGGALTHASDLDLIYLFTGDYMAESDGAKPLGAVLYYNRLAQRITSALSAQTASGPLYEIDTRLRPSGTQGPLSVSLDGFERYQRESAWTWEHMALTRARPVFGAPAARSATQAVIDAVLHGARPTRAIIADAVAMRAEMAAHKPPAGPLDAKLLPGGLVDLEFAVHMVQLTRLTGFDPHLGSAIDLLVAQRLAPRALRTAHDTLTRLLVTLRLVAPDAQPPAPATCALIARALGLPDWAGVIASLDATRQEVTDYLASVVADGGAHEGDGNGIG
ncbi:bifunctional [glutamine synthetase] adenylyltransferase/[glutamine synthetase]-adenylyl-L-tyrosine phosphorylase [Sphingomonas sp. AR_OL41]|uniref:bifunctional [glutamine synthetase] adenylyltransferase/[glutamine synthetase]-adenylyl-L-tyrosine phosphorylase n=1 Tax=Sphingomonas sp. AR_OL41 TaxID=3042729 RepID=UPI00247FC6AA|nr:bifunctional [glutamine synthetase] adenylyltransferase/[glutamine synthetase]-adenylyl-L-tyrosine phosphorylase [Sphingomonas sp. AR_OL41]MDH7971363.1 bifunctional [glutamine synthetase] adenylyltransferase/[glutamine synthetase]-adenylyl-L-tyrosine phosphorylase [Sphingomonas sp. AR_OL41]